MEKIIHDLQNYMVQVLGITINTEKWDAQNKIPFYLTDTYEFYQINILGQDVLAMTYRNTRKDIIPTVIWNHMKRLGEAWSGNVVFVHPAINAIDRSRLIQRKMPFIVPGNQMYLPILGIDLRERFKTLREVPKRLSPAAQALVIYILNRPNSQYLKTELLSQLRYTPMTLSRIYKELELTDLRVLDMRGKSRVLHINKDESRQALWEKALSYLRNPVRKRIWKPCDNNVPGIEAGLTALARYSMLAPPADPVYAVGPQEWMKMKDDNRIQLSPSGEPDTCEIEVWSYDPRLTAENNAVDRLSLFLSLRENNDERVQSALEETMRSMQW